MSGTYEDFKNDLAFQESSDQPWIENSQGYVGLYQMGEDALQDAGFYLKDPDATGINSWTGSWTGKDNVWSLDDYKNNPSAQSDAADSYFAGNVNSMSNLGLSDYLGTSVTLDDGTTVPVTESGMLAAAHLGGVGGLSAFLDSGGNSDPNDGGKSVSDYMQQFAGYDTPFDFNSNANSSQYGSYIPSSFDAPNNFPSAGDLFNQPAADLSLPSDFLD